MHVRDHIFTYCVLALATLFVISAFVRFMVMHDYVIAYEGECDPIMSSCFVGCEDEECTTEYYYTHIQKYASDLFRQCGNSIEDCEYATMCFPSDQNCSITYCDSSEEGEVCSTSEGSEIAPLETHDI